MRAKYPSLDIEVDGGVGPNTIDQCAKVLEQGFQRPLKNTLSFRPYYVFEI